MIAFTLTHESVPGRRIEYLAGPHADGPEADQRVCSEVPIVESSFRLDDPGGS